VHQHVRAKKESNQAKVVYMVHARMVSDASAAVAANDASRQAAFEARVKAARAEMKRPPYAIAS
jgi:hypothetical protein